MTSAALSARCQLDARDEEIRQQRIAAWSRRVGPRVGDFVEMLDGTLRRLTHDWGDDIQTTSGFQPGDVSFYFGDGHCSFSGSLDAAIPKVRLDDTGVLKDGPVWFFHHAIAGGGRAVRCAIPCRVYRQTPQS